PEALATGAAHRSLTLPALKYPCRAETGMRPVTEFGLHFFALHPRVGPFDARYLAMMALVLGRPTQPLRLPILGTDQGGVHSNRPCFLPSHGPFARHRPLTGEFNIRCSVRKDAANGFGWLRGIGVRGRGRHGRPVPFNSTGSRRFAR